MLHQCTQTLTPIMPSTWLSTFSGYNNLMYANKRALVFMHLLQDFKSSWHTTFSSLVTHFGYNLLELQFEHLLHQCMQLLTLLSMKSTLSPFSHSWNTMECRLMMYLPSGNHNQTLTTNRYGYNSRIKSIYFENWNGKHHTSPNQSTSLTWQFP